MLRFRTLVMAIAALLICAPAYAQGSGSPTVYVTDGNQGHIYNFTPPNTASPTIVTTFAGSTLEGLTYGPDGKLYVCDPTNGTIQRVNPNGTSPELVFAYSGTGPNKPQCGRFSSAGDLYVLDEVASSGVWRFTKSDLANLPTTPTPIHVLTSTQLHTGFGGSSDITQANNGDLLINDSANGNLFRVVYPFPPFPAAAQTALISSLDHPTGIARSSTGDIYIAQQGSTNKITRYNSEGGSPTDCGVFTGGANGDQPYFLKFSADDTLYVTTSQVNSDEESSNPFINGKIWTVSITSCASAPLQIANMPEVGEEGPNAPAFGIALPPTTTADKGPKPVAGSTNFNFGFTSFQITATSCNATVSAAQTLLSALAGATFPLAPPPAGTVRVPYLGEAGFGTLYHVTPGCTQANVLVGAFTPSLTNPRLVKCDPFPTSCAVIDANAVYPLGGPIPGDGAVGGKVPSFSDFYLVDEGLSSAPGVAGTFCGFNSPLNTNSTPATAPTFHTSLTTTIPVKFQLGNGNSCKTFNTSATVLLSVAQILTTGNVSVFIPLARAQFGGHGGDPSLFGVAGKQYIFNLVISSLPPGTYSASITFLTGNAPTQTTYFKVVTP